MPDRFVRVGLLISATFNALPVDVREFYVRLLLVVDDFGCFDGRESVIASQCFPAIATDVTAIAEWLRRLHMSGMIVRYSNAGKPYVAIVQWGCDLRGFRKFPAPPVDVDLDGITVRGKFGKPVGWSNPVSTDPVSILLDFDGRATVPQPPEWRPHSHTLRVTTHKVGWRPEARGERQAASDTQRVTSASDTQSDTRGKGEGVVLDLRSPGKGEGLDADVVDAGLRDTQPVTTTTPATPIVNGEIKFENGAIVGVTDAQVASWQETFYQLAVPDQIARAQAFLRVDAKTLAFWQSQPDGISSFLVRWLLRESKGEQILPAPLHHTGSAS